MKKALLLFVVCFMAFAPMAANASVRTEGMGILPQQSEDLDLIWLFPQKVDEYSVVDYRMGYLGSTDEWGGIIHKDPYIGQWGLYLARPFDSSDNYTGANQLWVDCQGGGILDGTTGWDTRLNWWGSTGPGGTPAIADPKNKLDLFKTFKAGNGNLGVHLNYAASRSGEAVTNTNGTPGGFAPGDVVDQTTAGNTGVVGVDLGYGMSDLGPFAAMDVALGYSAGSVDYSYIEHDWNAADTAAVEVMNGKIEGDGINEIRVNARLKKDANETTSIYINVNAKLGKLATKTTIDDPTVGGNPETLGDAIGEVRLYNTEYKNTYAQLGLNCDHKVNNGMGRVVAGLNFVIDNSEFTWTQKYNLANSTTADQLVTGTGGDFKNERDRSGLWANVGVEANLLKWLQLRAGMSRDIALVRDITNTTNGALVNNAYQTKSVDETWEQSQSTAALMTFGLGIAYKNWNVDLLTTKDAIEELLGSANPGRGLLYNGQILNDIVKGQIKYSL